MVKSVLGVNHQGLRDWVIQRVTSVVIAIAIIGLAIFFIQHPNLNFVEWRMLFAPLGMRVFTLLVVLSLAFHAWGGIWGIVTDYIHPALVRFVLHWIIFLTLLSSFFWILLTMWSV